MDINVFEDNEMTDLEQWIEMFLARAHYQTLTWKRTTEALDCLLIGAATHYKTPPLRNLCLKLCHVYVPEWRPRQPLFFCLDTQLWNNILGNLLYRCRRFMNKVFKYAT